ncbi:hypothetical protein BT96DRAFT_936661 [Gymnopus androsaceus JB14]|uniref:DUF6534 domain-containing protein n=1 Tax=Gymnopus androsaceus JB14 TaxID=1447944 RepID=A0A6A4HX80_9AGAR|nr:hypothetical protein BT96DRAFT_936661 [Gymnopus androsaceus JB14]
MALPSFNDTLGALYIGSTFATALYGVTCAQTFWYFTSPRSRVDNWAMPGLVLVVFVTSALDTVYQCFYSAGMYRFLVTDFVNPAALSAGGPTSGSKMQVSLVFFCRRLWIISATAYRQPVRIALVALTVALSLLNCGKYPICLLVDIPSTYIPVLPGAWIACTAVSVLGYTQHRIGNMENPPSYTYSHLDNKAAWNISNASGIAFDTILTIALTSSLYRARSGIRKTNHVINLIIIATVQTNLITTFFSIAQLFLVLPHATVYAGLSAILPKSYINSFLATLNSRDYLQTKLEDNTTVNLMTLESMTHRRFGSSQDPDSIVTDLPSTMNLRDGIKVQIEKSSDALTI